MTFWILFSVIFLVVTIGPIIFLRRIGSGRKPILAVVQPLNTTAIILTAPNTEEVNDQTGELIRVNNDGGNFVRIIHTAEGKVLVDTHPDPMEHYLEDEEVAPTDMRKAERRRKGLLHKWFGLQIIGFFRYVKINTVRKSRWGRKDNETIYSMQNKTDHPLYPDFVGSHDMDMENVETGRVLRIKRVRFNSTLEEKYPYRVRMRTADAYAQYTIMSQGWVVSEMSKMDPMKFIGVGLKKGEDDLKKKLVETMMSGEFKETIEGETGLLIRKITLAEFELDENTRDLLEGPRKAELAGKATVITARNKKKADILDNDVKADYVERVIKPAAESPGTVSVRWAEAHEKNSALNTLVNGSGGVLPILPLSAITDKKKEVEAESLD